MGDVGVDLLFLLARDILGARPCVDYCGPHHGANDCTFGLRPGSFWNCHHHVVGFGRCHSTCGNFSNGGVQDCRHYIQPIFQDACTICIGVVAGDFVGGLYSWFGVVVAKHRQ